MEAVDIFNKKYALADKKLLLAVSGGVDSMSLLFVYKDFNIVVAHFNHNLRKESTKEETYLKNLCQQRNIPFFSEKADVPPKSEEEARNMRYKFLRKVKEEQKAEHILTGHHLNDQVETFLFKLARGSGPLDLWGMKESEGNTLRPFLSLPKKDLIDYALNHKIKYFEDKTNKNVKFSRNRIRRNIIPELEKINPKAQEQIASTIKMGQEASEILKKTISQEGAKIVSDDTLDIAKLKEVPSTYIQDAILRNFLKAQTETVEIGQKNIAELRKIIESTGNKKTAVAGVTFKKVYDKLTTKHTPASLTPKSKRLTDGLNFAGFTFCLHGKGGASGKNNIYLPRSLAYNLYVKVPETGDRIKTRSGTKKLQDLFSDAKIPKEQRIKWPVVTNSDEIIWVPLLAKHQNHKDKKNVETINIEVINETSN
jgi:tRNA(Ile)-lysidine synthase